MRAAAALLVHQGKIKKKFFAKLCGLIFLFDIDLGNV